MDDDKKSFRLDIRIDRASTRRALVIGGALVILGVAASVSIAVPVTYSDGNVLTASDLNQNFTNVEQRLAALEKNAGVGPTYSVRKSLSIPGQGTTVTAYCNSGDRLIAGSCVETPGSGVMVFWKSEPVLTGTNGWSCAATVQSFSGTYTAQAFCAGNGSNQSLDAGIYAGFDAGTCPGSAVFTRNQFPPTRQCQVCAATHCCSALDACLLDNSCVVGSANAEANSIIAGQCIKGNCPGC